MLKIKHFRIKNYDSKNYCRKKEKSWFRPFQMTSRISNARIVKPPQSLPKLVMIPLLQRLRFHAVLQLESKFRRLCRNTLAIVPRKPGTHKIAAFSDLPFWSASITPNFVRIRRELILKNYLRNASDRKLASASNSRRNFKLYDILHFKKLLQNVSFASFSDFLTSHEANNRYFSEDRNALLKMLSTVYQYMETIGWI